MEEKPEEDLEQETDFKPIIESPVTEVFGIKFRQDADIFLVGGVLLLVMLLYLVKCWIDHLFACRLKRYK